MPHLTLVRACALAALLLLAQAMGLAHGVAHAPWGSAQAGDFAWPTWGGSHQAGDADCRLIDQLGHADATAPGLQAWLPPAPAAQPVPARPDAAPRARPVAAYCARAPPH